MEFIWKTEYYQTWSLHTTIVQSTFILRFCLYTYVICYAKQKPNGILLFWFVSTCIYDIKYMLAWSLDSNNRVIPHDKYKGAVGK